ncbi:MAG: DNA polymerase III subunit alpha [Proteobacteria bacterium]|nr:DNA polymerase III subunit alpha [Pseudomonadota bacterium]
MSHAKFVHLHVHSAYSLSEGAIKLPQLISLCEKEGMPAVAVTDTGNLFGALEFSLAARRAGVQPIIGCQIAVARPTGIGAAHGHRAPGQRADLDDLVLLVRDRTGYQNLLKLASRSFLETPSGERPHITFDDLEKYSEGLIALTSGPSGAVGALLAAGQHDAATEMLQRLMTLFPGALYVELMRHGEAIEDRIDGPLIDLAYKHELPLVATNNCYFSDPDMFEAHDALLCIAAGAHVSDRERRRLTPLYGFRSAEEMQQAFADVPEAIDNTLIIAQRCAFMPDEHAPILPAFSTPDGITETEMLRAEAEEGLEARMAVLGLNKEGRKPYVDRLNFELDVIVEMGFPGYFLIVSDFIKWAKAQGIPVGPGRGSGAGSVVAWSLSITDLDPLEFGLLFERFLNPERVSMPDFDIDFCQDRRDEVIRYVQDKYGSDQVAQIITFGKLQARAVLRDVGRVLAMPYGYVDKICKLVPFNPAHPPSLKEALEQEPELRRLQKDDEQVARLLDIGMRLEGLFRHASTHAAGVVIGDRRLDELVPLYQDPRSSMAATQFSMKYAEAAGLVKFDFLGLKTLTVLAKAVGFLAERGVDIDLLQLPLKDEKTFEMLGRGDTIGVFQLESSGMRDVLRQMKPDCFGDIIALVALYRPGPMDNIPRYIACKHGKEEPDYLHPDLEGILKETFGVMIYQEQVMQIAQVLSGFSLGSADLLRRAMGKKIKSEMEAQRNAFVEGAVARAVDKGQAGQIFDQVDKFAGYGFNKSHAAAYALVAYQTAWLKANYPVEFLAASMTLELGNTDKLNTFRQELGNLGIPLLPPDINDSDVAFGVRAPKNENDKGAIRYALAAIKNVGAQAMASVVAERRENGLYEDVFDFAERIGAKAANKRQLENLVRAGALDSLHKNRRQLFEGVEILLKTASAAERDRADQQVSLFDGQDDMLPKQQDSLPDIQDWLPIERLKQEMDAVGLYLSAHPLDDYRTALERLGVVPLESLTVSSAGSKPRVAGVVVRRQDRTSAKGNRFAFLQLSCIDGELEVVLFSEILSSSRDLLESGKPLLLTCEARGDGDGVRLSALSVEDLDVAVARSGAGLKVHIDREDAFLGLRSIITQGKQGKGQVRLLLDIDNRQSVELSLPGGYAVSADLRAAISAVPGVIELRDI